MGSKGFGSVLADKVNWMLVGALALVGSGSSLNAGTTAYFTSTVSVSGNSFQTADVKLASGSGFTAMSFTKLVPGDTVIRKVSITNDNTSGQAVAFPYYVNVTRDSGASALDGTNGLKLMAIRCYDAATASGAIQGTANLVDCDAAGALSAQPVGGWIGSSTPFDISGPLTTSNTAAVGQSGGAAAGSASVSINGTTVAGVTLPTGSTAKLMGGPAGASGNGGVSGLNNPNITGLSAGSGTVDIPTGSSVVGLGAGKTDKVTIIAWLPTAADAATLGFSALSSGASYTVNFTGVQPNGATTTGTSALR